ncbi:MAG TPA: hypothetical protein VI278_02975 [Nitrososphaeraceae archaeon]
MRDNATKINEEQEDGKAQQQIKNQLSDEFGMIQKSNSSILKRHLLLSLFIPSIFFP